jgi:hypothetical protein
MRESVLVALTAETLMDDLRAVTPEAGSLVDEHMATYGEILPHVLFDELTQYVIEAHMSMVSPRS